MATPAPTERMSAEQSAALAEFARSCKTAARSVSLYPASHPAIQGALGRVAASVRRLTDQGDVTIAVLPDILVIEGRVPAKPDSAIGELAALLHSRLEDEVAVGRSAEGPSLFFRTSSSSKAACPQNLIRQSASSPSCCT